MLQIITFHLQHQLRQANNKINTLTQYKRNEWQKSVFLVLRLRMFNNPRSVFLQVFLFSFFPTRILSSNAYSYHWIWLWNIKSKSLSNQIKQKQKKPTFGSTRSDQSQASGNDNTNTHDIARNGLHSTPSTKNCVWHLLISCWLIG